MPRPKEHVVTLSAGDRVTLSRVVSTGTHPARMITRARVLLELDETDGPGAASAGGGRAGRGVGETRLLVAKRFTESAGMSRCVIGRRKRITPPVPAKVTGDVEARVIALACTQPPAGYHRWSLRLLEKQVAAHRRDPAAGPLHDRSDPEKRGLRPHLKKCWTIPPHASGEFVARMEDVLEVYHRPYDPDHPGGVHGREALPAARPRP